MTAYQWYSRSFFPSLDYYQEILATIYYEEGNSDRSTDSPQNIKKQFEEKKENLLAKIEEFKKKPFPCNALSQEGKK